MRASRNNVLAGGFVLTAILAASAVVIVLGGLQEKLGKHDYNLFFDLKEGTLGLDAGSKIFLGGRPIGSVKSFRFSDEGQDGTPTGILVTIGVDKSIRFREGAVGHLLSPLLGGSGTINFHSLGAGPELTKDDVIQCIIAPPSFLADAGFGEGQKRDLQVILKEVREASEKINTFMDDARVVSADVRAKWPRWSERVESVTEDVSNTAARGPAIAQSIEERLEQWRTAVDDGRKIIETAQAYLDENRADVRQTITSAKNIGSQGEAFMARLNSELSEKAAAFFEDGREAFVSGGEVMDRVSGVVNEHSPTIRRAMANFRLASDQLAATLQEVRRSPWRLLYRPDRRELEFELLYDSARAYAGAVGDLRSTTETIQSIHAASEAGTLADANARIGVLLGELDGVFARYKETEAEFLRQLKIHADGK